MRRSRSQKRGQDVKAGCAQPMLRKVLDHFVTIKSGQSDKPTDQSHGPGVDVRPLFGPLRSDLFNIEHAGTMN